MLKKKKIPSEDKRFCITVEMCILNNTHDKVFVLRVCSK